MKEGLTIPSFCVDHCSMEEGISVSRVDTFGAEILTTYDVRICKPNRGAIMPAAMHTLEHLLAVWFRNKSGIEKDIVYVGPMGCLTGLYLIVHGYYELGRIRSLLIDAFRWVSRYEGDIPGATEKECGNYRMHSISEARGVAKEFLNTLEDNAVVVIASEKERGLVDEILGTNRHRIIVTGVGGTNVIRALSGLDRATKIINIGYVGSADLPVGTILKVGRSSLLHESCDYEEVGYDLGGKVPCFTSTDFVTHTDKTEGVFDMELAFICALGFEVSSYKKVSDNLNYKQYEDNIK